THVWHAALPEVMAAIIHANGFPLYYVDANGLALQPCLNLAGCGALAASLPNPLAPISFPANFPAEAFYARAVAKLTAGTVSGIYTAAREGTFFNGVVAAGNQMVFTRVRIRVAGLQPAGLYTVTHPYGVKTLTADALGVINDTVTVGAVPIGLVPTAFSLALAGPVGPTFLTWDTAPPPGPARTAATLCTNTACHCAGTCGFVSSNAIPCTDGNVCTAGDTCTLGACLGTPANCDDANVCTTDFCTPPAVGCGHLNNALACDDGKPATTGDSCSGGKCMGFISDAKLTLIAG